MSPLTGPLAGGALVTILGSGFGAIAVVTLEEIGVNGAATGVQLTCEWSLDNPATSCNATVVTYVNPMPQPLLHWRGDSTPLVGLCYPLSASTELLVVRSLWVMFVNPCAGV